MGISQSVNEGAIGHDAKIACRATTEKCSHTPIATTTIASFMQGTYLKDPMVREALHDHRMFAKYKSVLKHLPKYVRGMCADRLVESDLIIRHPCGYSIVAVRDKDARIKGWWGKTEPGSHYYIVDLFHVY